MRKILSFLTAILFAGSMMAADYVKVTSTADITDGNYLIVYEATSLAFNGSLETLDASGNGVSVTIADGKIASTEAVDAYAFTLNVQNGTILSSSGHYIGVTGNSNGLKQNDNASTYSHTFAIDESGNADVYANFSSSTMYLRYNPSTSSGNLRFRYYKNKGQQPIALYKYVASQGGDDPQPVQHTYTVAGSSTDLFGTAWDPANAANDMVLQEDNTYKWEKADLTLAAGEIKFKVCEDHAWDVAYPASDYVLNIQEAGVYTITITYNPADNNAVNAVAQKTGSAVVIPTVAMHGNFSDGTNWADTENFAVAEGNETASLTLNLAAGDYEFGMRIGGSGNWTANGAAFTRENNSAVIEAGQGNITLDADAAGEYTFTWTYATNTLTVTYPEYVEPTYNFADGYYLIGLDMADWNMENMPAEGRLFAANPDNEGEYQLTITLAADQQFKVVSVQKDQIKNWYPDGMDNNYIVDAAHAGEKTVYFRPDGQGGQDWHYGCIYVAANEAPVVVELQAVSEATTWDFSKITANTGNALYNKEGIQLTDESTPSKNDEMVYANYSADFMTFAEGFDAATMAFKGEYPIRKNQYCQAGTLRFKTTVAGTITVKFSDTGSSASATAVKRYLVVNGEQTEYWTSRQNNGTEPYDAQLNVTSGEIAVPAGDVTITGSSAIVVSNVTFTPEAPAKFYVTGNAALVGQDKEWNPSAIKSEADTLELNLEAGVDYILKVAVNGTWEGENNVKGYNELTEKTAGLLDLGDDHNIGFKLNEAGIVKVIYKAAAEEQPEVFKLIGNFYVAPAPDPTVAVKGSMNDWAEEIPFVLSDDKTYASLTVENIGADEYEFKFIINGEYRSNGYRFHREFTGAAGITENNEANMVFVADQDGEYTFYWYFANDSAAIVYPAAPVVVPAKFYITGDSALVVDAGLEADKAWAPAAIKVETDTMALTLKAKQAYKLKITLDGDWATGRGYSSLSEKPEGITTDADDNIIFTLVENGAVNVIYVATEDTMIFKVEGNFYVAPAPDPTVAVKGSMNDWAEEIPFVLSDDKTYASLTVENIGADEYEFKFIINGEYRSNGYRFHREFTGAAGITENNEANMVFVADQDGEYTFYWYFANDSAAIVYPAAPVVVPAKFYITGDSALVVDAGLEADKAWAPAAIKVETDTMALTLKAKQAYTLKITLDGDWATGRGYSSLSEKPEGITTDADDNIIFTLVENGAVNVIYVATEDTTIFKVEGNFYVAPVDPTEHTYTVAGSLADAFGTSWEPANAANDMVKQEDGTYKWEKADLTLAAGEIKFKVCKDHSWAVAYPAGDYVLNIQEAGVYTITITYNPADNNAVNAVAQKTGDAEVTVNYYLVGSVKGWEAKAENIFTLNAEAGEGIEEYVIETTLAEGEGLKVVSSTGTWYPDGTGNEYVVDQNHAGATTIYFRPAGNAEWAAFGGYMYVVPTDPTALDEIMAAGKAVKIVRNGQILIIKGEKIFNAQGQLVK